MLILILICWLQLPGTVYRMHIKRHTVFHVQKTWTWFFFYETSIKSLFFVKIIFNAFENYPRKPFFDRFMKTGYHVGFILL